MYFYMTVFVACEHKEQPSSLLGRASNVQQKQLVAAALPGHGERDFVQPRQRDSSADLGCVLEDCRAPKVPISLSC